MKNNIKKIIFIVTDTLRAQNVGLYGANPSPTPNIDSLGKKGVVFTNAYTTITKTDPAITAIMTGRYPLSAGLINQAHDISKEEEKNLTKIPFLPEILQSRGYKTAAVDWLGRWHKRGYDYYSGKINSDAKTINFALNTLPLLFYLKTVDKMLLRFLKRDLFTRFYYSFFSKPAIPYDPADLVVNKAIEVLRKNRSKNLFLYMHFWDAHFPHSRSRGLKSYLFDTVDQTYAAEIKFLDVQIGRFIDHLKSIRELDNTLIILTADHGENFYEYGRAFNHEGLYENVVKIPLIFFHSSLQPRRITSLVQHVDILPTILDLLSISYKNNVDGYSLLPLIKNKKTKIRDFIFFEDILHRSIKLTKCTRKRGIRQGNYKYIETLQMENSKTDSITSPEDITIFNRELYNLKQDPSERENIIKKKKKLAKEIESNLKDFIRTLNTKRIQKSKLAKKIEKSLSVIRKATREYNSEELVLAWTGGKDSTVLLHLVRMAFGGKVPFRIIFNDSTMEFEEIYEFIDKMEKLWDLKIITVKHDKKELREFQETKDLEKKKLMSRMMKITAINQALKKYNFKAFMVGIRWDEHESRSKEKYFSSRPNHMRIHPILQFTEKDIWGYIHHFGVPYVKLYDKGYRSLGEKPFTKPVPPGGNERSGREREKEQTMERLRKMGYW